MEKEKREAETLIDAATERLKLAIRHLGTSLTLFLVGYYSTRWILEDKKIKDTPENYEAINRMNEAQASFFNESVLPFIASVGLVLWQIKSITTRYYRKTEEYEKRTLPERVISTITDSISTAFGFRVDDKDNVTILPNGWLYNLGDLSDIYRRVREEAIKAVTAREGWDSFQLRLKKMIEGDERISGLMRAHFRTIVDDVYSEYYRMIQYKNAIQLGYRSGIYEGGLIQESRPFCIERNGKVFTFDEIQKFGTREDKFEGYSDKDRGLFDGKPRFEYDPFFDQGGHNCRHYYSYIPDALAIYLRPELKEVWEV